MTTRRRRWIEVLRRTAGVATETESERAPGMALDDAALWKAQDQASKSMRESSASAERLAAAVARQRALIDGAAERARQVAARAENVSHGAVRIKESFDRLGIVALNAGLESARIAEPHGRALELLSEEIRSHVVRGADGADELVVALVDLASESAEVRRQLERSQSEVAEVGREAAQLQAAGHQAAQSLDDLGARLRRATGIDPEMARLLGLAGEHARELTTALSALSTADEAAPLLGALRPAIGPLARLLAEIEERGPAEDDQAPGSAEDGA